MSPRQIGIIGRNQAVEDVAYVLFSVFNVIWATVYLETWKRRGAELAYRWGTLDQRDDLLVEPRPLFTVSFRAKRINVYTPIVIFLRLESKFRRI